MRNIYKYARTAMLALLVLATVNIYAQQFEGIITMNTTNASNGEKAQVEWLASNGNHKMIINGTADGKSVNYALLFLKGSSDAKMLTDIGGEPAIFNLPSSSFQGQGISISAPAVTKAAQADVSGFKTTKYLLEGAEGSISVWVSDQVPFTSDQLPALMNKGSLLETLKANNIKGIPVKVIANDPNGQQLYTQTITSVKSQTVSAAEFTLTGYSDGEQKLKDAVQKQ